MRGSLAENFRPVAAPVGRTLPPAGRHRCAAIASSIRLVISEPEISYVFLRRLVESVMVAGGGVANDAERGVIVERQLQPSGRLRRSVRDHGHAGTGHVTGIAAAAGMDRNQVGL